MPSHRSPAQQSTLPEVVDPAWLLKTIAAVIAVGLCLAYLSLCALFFFAQWQFVLHPSRTVSRTPAAEGLRFETVRFGDDLSGQPQLAGWWIPSDLPTDPTVLLLHGQDGSMADAIPYAHALHDARLNVLLFDYRGYGASGGHHPTERLMRGDAQSAFTYLTQTRHILPQNIVVYGRELGASLAVQLCAQQSQIAALVLQSADGDTLTRVLRDARTRLIPVQWLFHERFPLADPLSRLKTPKLLVSFTNGAAPEENQRAADPKTTVELPPSAAPDAIAEPLRRFLNTYVAHPPGLL